LGIGLGKQIYRILQIGDVHFPDGKDSNPKVDAKDDGISKPFVETIASNSFRASVRKVMSLLEEEDIDFVTFMGDLTTKGNLEGYRECLQFLAKGLRLDGKPLIPSEQILIVAGNHDVCRKTAINNPARKFAVLNDMLDASGFQKLVEMQVDHRSVLRGPSGIHFLGINSCMGCGERRFLPSRVRDAIFDKIDADMANPHEDTDAVLEDIYEQIDAPAISAETIEELVRKVEALDRSSLGIIVAHHNLLPQSNPRIDPYTELINSGSLRSTISQMGRPILYLHGHIHADPVEIITNPTSGKLPLICVSAPAFEDGFNILEIAFDSGSTPIGCRIVPHRANDSGYIVRERHVVVPFGGIPTRILDAQASMTASIILRRRSLTWEDLLEEQSIKQSGLDAEQIAEKTTELYWHGLVEIENLNHEPSAWRIRSLMG
jgi:3',5'-cyclic AMP phosphodiesterase CpdA